MHQQTQAQQKCASRSKLFLCTPLFYTCKSTPEDKLEEVSKNYKNAPTTVHTQAHLGTSWNKLSRYFSVMHMHEHT